MAVAAKITYSYRDRKGKIASTSLNIPSTTTASDMFLFAQEMAKLIDPLVRGALVGATITLGVEIPPGVTVVPWDDSDVEEKASFQFISDDGYTKMNIPAVDEAGVVTPQGEIDQTNPDVLAFVTAMENGIDLLGVGGSGVIEPTDSRESDIYETVAAYESFRNSGSRR